MRRILLLVLILVSVVSFGISENIAYAHGSRPFVNYNAYSGNQTSQNYNIMYRDDGEVYMLMTMGQGYSKTCVIVDRNDIDNMRRGRINDDDLARMSYSCKNYKFGNNLHCVYRNGEVEFVVLCNPTYGTISINGRLIGDSEYLMQYRAELIAVE